MTTIKHVKDLIKYLADFNPNAIIRENIDIAWVSYGGADSEGERDIEQEKLDAEEITLFSSAYCEENIG